MLKPENKINWKDSNLALFGSDLEDNIKSAAAEGETAWDGLGQDVTLRVWRIEKFKVKAWPKNKHGKVRNENVCP
jgi:gelsolin